MTSTAAQGRRASGKVGGRVRHFVEMVVAMALGMALLHPPARALATARWQAFERADVDSLLMTACMTVPMVAWMLLRGHAARHAATMSLAMLAGFVVLFPPLWLGLLDPGSFLLLGHVLMLLFMWLVTAPEAR